MKNAILLLTGLVSFNLLLVGCTPRDEKIDDPRLKNFRGYNENGKPSGGGAKQKSIRVGYFALSSMLVEKEMEAVQMARVALGVDTPEQAGFAQSRHEDAVMLTANANAKLYQTPGPVSSFETKAFVVSEPAENQENAIVEVRGEKDLTQFLSKLNVAGSAKRVENTYLLKVTDGKGVLYVTLETKGFYTLADEGGSTPALEFTETIKLTVDDESLKSDKVNVKKVESEVNIAFTKGGRPTRVAIQGFNHEVAFNGSCVSLTGESKMVTDKTGKIMKYVNNEATVPGSSFQVMSGACGSRPTVDLSRLFTY